MLILTDIHGNYETMLALLAKIPQEEKDKGIVVCGDLIDRGPRSKQVVQYMIDNNIPCVKGNHEQMMIDNSHDDVWYQDGGVECLRSYGPFTYMRLSNPEDLVIFEAHQQWMENLPLYLEFPEVKNADGRHLVISHSSINGVWKYRNNTEPKNGRVFEMNVLWGRPSQINDVPEIFNVFGHTPQKDGPRIRDPFANIDTGCFYKEKGYGVLTALAFPSMRIYTQENID